MEKIKSQLYDLDKNIDNYLFYDKEEFNSNAVFASGKQEGQEEGQAIIVKNMKLNGMSNEEISRMTGLSLRKVEKLLSIKIEKEAD